MSISNPLIIIIISNVLHNYILTVERYLTINIYALRTVSKSRLMNAVRSTKTLIGKGSIHVCRCLIHRVPHVTHTHTTAVYSGLRRAHGPHGIRRISQHE